MDAVREVSSISESEKVYKEFRHVPALDGLRGIAVLLVMMYHLDSLIPQLYPFVKGGFLGVDVFFVLSGFLITSILIKEYELTNKIFLKNFYVRRFLRLAPAFWLFLICLFFIDLIVLPTNQNSNSINPYNLFFSFFYLMNWYAAISPGMTGSLNHTWSLAIEEQFYIIWSLVIYKFFSEGKTRKQLVRFTTLTALLLIICRGLRAGMGVDPYALYYSTDTRIDALLIGCLASMIFSWQSIPNDFYQTKLFNSIAFSAIVLALLILFNFTYLDPILYYAPLSIFAFSIAIIILWLSTRENTLIHQFMENKTLRWIGVISYGLYLWHFVMFEFAKKSFDSIWFQAFGGIILAFLVSAISYYLVEKPFLKLKEKFS